MKKEIEYSEGAKYSNKEKRLHYPDESIQMLENKSPHLYNALVRHHFTAITQLYDEKTKQRENYLAAVDNLIIAQLQSAFKRRKGLLLLDIGCGTGRRIEKIAHALYAPIVYGIDISPTMVEQAKKKLPFVFEMDMLALNIKKEAFDCVFCLFNSLGYLSTYKQRLIALRNIHTHLTKDGLLFIDVMNILHKGEGITFQRTWNMIIKEFLYSCLNPQIIGIGNKLFTLKINNQAVKGFVHGFFNYEIQWLLRTAGFSIEQRYIIGYDSGKIKQKITQGQLFYICRKR